jgi:hypothetical protein
MIFQNPPEEDIRRVLFFWLVLSRKGDILSSAVKLQHERVKNGTVQAGIY